MYVLGPFILLEQEVVHEKVVSGVLYLRKIDVAAVLSQGEKDGLVELVHCVVGQVGRPIVALFRLLLKHLELSVVRIIFVVAVVEGVPIGLPHGALE